MTKYARILSVILAIDLISTIIIIDMGWGTEANPFMLLFYMKWGLVGLSLAKIIISVICIGMIEWIWKNKPEIRHRIKFYYICVILFYVVVYPVMFAVSNLL